MEGINALVVDDVKEVREMVSRRLAAMGHGSDLAGSAEEARELLENGEYSYVILDMEIPESFGGVPMVDNGHLLLDYIRRKCGPKEVFPVIVISGAIFDLQEATELVTVQEANDFVVKPLKATGRHRLEDAVEKCMAQLSARRALPAVQRAVNCVPTREWLRPDTSDGSTVWTIMAKDGTVRRLVYDDSTKMGALLHCMHALNDSPEGIPHESIRARCDFRNYFVMRGGVVCPQRGPLRNYVSRLKRECGIGTRFVSTGVVFLQPDVLPFLPIPQASQFLPNG